MYNLYNMNMILKTHIIYHHLKDYFYLTEKTLKYVNGEFVEGAHSSLKKHEDSHGFKVTINKGSDIHVDKALKSHIWFNSKRAGFTPSSKFRLRNHKSSISSTTFVSSPCKYTYTTQKQGVYNHSEKFLNLKHNLLL